MLGNCKNEEALDNGLQAIHLLEEKSDALAFKVNEDITTGAVSPNILDSLH